MEGGEWGGGWGVGWRVGCSVNKKELVGGGGVAGGGGGVTGVVCGGDVIKSCRAIFFLLSVMRTNVPNTDGGVGGWGDGEGGGGGAEQAVGRGRE